MYFSLLFTFSLYTSNMYFQHVYLFARLFVCSSVAFFSDQAEDKLVMERLLMTAVQKVIFYFFLQIKYDVVYLFIYLFDCSEKAVNVSKQLRY